MKVIYVFPHVEDVSNIAEEKVHFIIDLRFQSDNLCENVHDVFFEDKSENLQMFPWRTGQVLKMIRFLISLIFYEEEQPTLICALSLTI